MDYIEKFLKQYVRETAECMDIELSVSQVKQIVHNLENCNTIWEVLDEYIKYEIDDIM